MGDMLVDDLVQLAAKIKGPDEGDPKEFVDTLLANKGPIMPGRLTTCIVPCSESSAQWHIDITSIIRAIRLANMFGVNGLLIM